ncbi:MAG: SRPBCC family protein [Phycisphaerales bacterium JB043]
MRTFSIDPDITVATTPPGWFYTDPAHFHDHARALMPRAWHMIADTSAVSVPGAVHPVTYCPGLLDEPLLLTRDRDDQLHLLSNVCTHRGMRLAEHPDNTNCLTCRYHGRRFNLDGTFRSMPEFTETKNFPRPEDNLAAIPMTQYRQFIFASLDPAHPFDGLVQDMDARIGHLPIEQAKFDSSRARDYLVSCHWALYVENFLEGFHVPFVHNSLADALDYGAYSTILFERSNLQLGIASGSEHTFDLPSGHPDEGQNVAAWYFWLFPTTMFNVYPWGISINVVEPISVNRTRVRFLPYVWDESKLDLGASGDLDRVEREDESIVEQIQRSIGSRSYTTGRYSPTREQGVHQFHTYLASTS